MGQLIERAIDPSSPDTNLGLFFEVTDMINSKEEKYGFHHQYYIITR
jgi:hypothetical protein